jgi:hypothetical protein
MQYYISKTKAAFNPANTNTPDTFVSRGYDTREEAKAVLATMPFDSDLCVIQHDPNKIYALSSMTQTKCQRNGYANSNRNLHLSIFIVD